MSWQYLDQRDACDSPLCVLVLCGCRGDRPQGETEYRNCEPNSLLHSTSYLLEIDAPESNCPRRCRKGQSQAKGSAAIWLHLSVRQAICAQGSQLAQNRR